jgi:hypothetical protein
MSNLRAGALDITAGEVAILAGEGASQIAGLTIADGASLDLRDNALIVPGGDIEQLTARIASAYNFSAWDGDGIRTSQPDAGPALALTTLAIATADDGIYAGRTFRGVSVDAGDVIIMYTYAGDMNLDGLIDVADYGSIDNWIQFPGTAGYQNGDLNFDGVIDVADYGVIDNSIQLQGDPFDVSGAGGGGGGGAAAMAVITVPEPGVLSYLIIAGVAAASRRRRRRRSDAAAATRLAKPQADGSGTAVTPDKPLLASAGG